MKDDKSLTVSQVHDFTLTTEDVKKYIAPDATDKELFTFINVAKSYGLNPWKRECHFIKYGGKPGQTVVGYEVYIKRAEATGKLDGWSVSILDKGKPDERAQITIYRKDRTQPFVWETYRSEFDKKQSVWLTMPTFMLKKVAISQGFRLGFPEELGGMPYIPEELPSNSHSTTSESLSQVEIVDVSPPPAPVARQDTPTIDSDYEDEHEPDLSSIEWWRGQMKALTSQGEAKAWAKKNAGAIKQQPWHVEFRQEFAEFMAGLPE
jgi:phage recombination protein Bet